MCRTCTCRQTEHSKSTRSAASLVSCNPDMQSGCAKSTSGIHSAQAECAQNLPSLLAASAIIDVIGSHRIILQMFLTKVPCIQYHAATCACPAQKGNTSQRNPGAMPVGGIAAPTSLTARRMPPTTGQKMQWCFLGWRPAMQPSQSQSPSGMVAMP